MSEFDSEANLSLSVADGELRSVRDEIEAGLDDIEIGIDASVSGPGGQPRDPRSGRFMSKRGAEQRLVEQQTTLEDIHSAGLQRNEYLETMVRQLDDIKDATGGGGGLGGPRLRRRGGGGGGGGGGGLLGLGLGLGVLGGGLISFLQTFEFTPPDIPPLEVPEIPPIPVNAPSDIPVDAPSTIPVNAPSSIPVNFRVATPSGGGAGLPFPPETDAFPVDDLTDTPSGSPSQDPHPFPPEVGIGAEEVLTGAAAVAGGGAAARLLQGSITSGASSGASVLTPAILPTLMDRLNINALERTTGGNGGTVEVSAGDTQLTVETNVEQLIEDALDELRGEQERERDQLRREIRRETGVDIA